MTRETAAADPAIEAAKRIIYFIDHNDEVDDSAQIPNDDDRETVARRFLELQVELDCGTGTCYQRPDGIHCRAHAEHELDLALDGLEKTEAEAKRLTELLKEIHRRGELVGLSDEQLPGFVEALGKDRDDCEARAEAAEAEVERLIAEAKDFGIPCVHDVAIRQRAEQAEAHIAALVKAMNHHPLEEHRHNDSAGTPYSPHDCEKCQALSLVSQEVRNTLMRMPR